MLPWIDLAGLQPAFINRVLLESWGKRNGFMVEGRMSDHSVPPPESLWCVVFVDLAGMGGRYCTILDLSLGCVLSLVVL